MSLDNVPTTKRDLKLLKDHFALLKGDFALLKGDLKEFRRDTTRELVKICVSFDKFEESFRGEMRAMESKITKQLAGFRWARMSDHAKIIADWRVAQLEKRVDKIESHPS